MNIQPTPICTVIRATEKYEGKQKLEFGGAVSAESVGSKGICMHLITIPPGAKGKAHMHEDRETAMYYLSGEGHMWYGENLQDHLTARAGDFIYIPAGVPHLPYNLSETEPATAVIARTDPNEQESVVLLPELDQLH